MGEFSESSRDGHVLTVTINRPEVMNALHPKANAELAGVWDEFAADPDLWVGIITGAGDRAFSAGNDLKHQASGGDMSGMPPSGFGGLTSRFDLDKPVIAAVNGMAVGGGFELALAADFIIAAEHAEFFLPEPAVGIIPDAGGVLRLPRRLPRALAQEMLFAGRRLGAAEAERWGLVNRCVAAETLMIEAYALADRIIAQAPLAILALKQVLRATEAGGIEAAYRTMRQDCPAYRRMLDSEDAKEGPRAFAEGRSPLWRAR